MNELSVAKLNSDPSFVLGQSPKVLFVHHLNNGSLHLAQQTISAMFRDPRIDIVPSMAGALETVDKERYDLIFIEDDLGNNESGAMVARALRTKNVAAPLVGFCVNLSEALRQTCLGAGMADVVMPDKLEAFLRQHIVPANNVVPRQLVLNDMPRIVIIDDDLYGFKISMAKDIIASVFPKARLTLVETGEAALEHLKAGEQDVAFIDFNLGPRVKADGQKEKVYGDMVARDLRQAGVNLYFVGFSDDMSNEEKKTRCLNAGMDDTIVPTELCRYLIAHKSKVNVG